MSAPSAIPHLRRLDRHGVGEVVRRLETDFGRRPDGEGAVEHQYLLEALDRGEHSRFFLWPAGETVAVLYAGPSGTVVPAGDAAAAPWLVEAMERTEWRVMIGPAELGWALLEQAGQGLFRRRPNARTQRFMVARGPVPGSPPSGLRTATVADVDTLTDFACALHVDDRMGPPISRSARWSVRRRMLESVRQGATWVVQRDGGPVAKVDVSLYSPTRGAQIAGVYVTPAWRGRGLGGAAVAAVTRELFDRGLPLVTLHVRADNAPAIAAYTRAGFRDQAQWVLALR